MPLFGLAGLAEAGIAAEQGLMCIGVFLTGLAAFLGLLLRSKIAAVVGVYLFIMTTLVFFPWEAFRPEPSDDPDVHSFQASFRRLAWWWIIASAGAIGAFVWVFLWRRPRREHPEQESPA
jgi:hypothetical protein